MLELLLVVTLLLDDAVDEILLSVCELELLLDCSWLDCSLLDCIRLDCIRLDSDWLDAMLETADEALLPRLLDSLLNEEIGVSLLDWLEPFPEDPPPHPQSITDNNNTHNHW